MASKMSATVCFLWVCLVFGADLHLTCGQPTVSLTIETPPAECKEGETIRMRCSARNLQASQIVEWATATPDDTIIWNGSITDALHARSEFKPYTVNGEIIQNLTLRDVRRNDSGEYFCNIRKNVDNSTESLVASDNVSLSVWYFPNNSFPNCTPQGPTTRNSGEELSLRCLSQDGNPRVKMSVSVKTGTCHDCSWITSYPIPHLDTQMNLTLKVDASINNTSFECTISSMYMNRSCMIGPITVPEMTPNSGPPVTPTPIHSTHKPTLSNNDDNDDEDGKPSSNLTTELALGAVALIVFILCGAIVAAFFHKHRSKQTREEPPSSIAFEKLD